MKSTLLASGALFGALAFSTAASAQDAYVTTDLNMRAGPGTRYPVVTTIPDSRGINVYGCTRSNDWCDVSWRGNRGWVYSDYIEYIYQGRRVMLPEYRDRIDLPAVSFSFGTYWDRHYRDRPWYDDRERWWDGRRGGDRDDDRDYDRDYDDRDYGDRNGNRGQGSGRWGDDDDDDGNEYSRRQGDSQQYRRAGDEDERQYRRAGGESERRRGPDWCEGENCPPFGNGR